jgi:hypothetical protein
LTPALQNPDEEIKRASARRTRRSFLVAGIGAVGAFEFYRWLRTAPSEAMLQTPFRKALEFNAKVARGVFDERGLAPTYHVSEARDLRVNGNYGLKQELIAASYRLQVVGVEGAAKLPQYVPDVTAWEYQYKAAEGQYQGHDTKEAPKTEAAPDPTPASIGRPKRGMEEAGESDSTLDPGTPGLLLTLDDVTRLQHRELVTQFKCIEGWSEIVHWGGVRLRDFIASYPPARNAQGKLPKYVYMETPNGDYYTGYHLNECMHPQSLLVTEMAGQPLSQWHGAPLRLHMPIKYGYKQIKRIGLIAYTDDKPDDYWTKLGYDWYAGI